MGPMSFLHHGFMLIQYVPVHPYTFLARSRTLWLFSLLLLTKTKNRLFIYSLQFTIQGLLLPRFAEGLNTVFIRRNESSEELHDDFVVCSVEQVALDYYLENGYNDGRICSLTDCQLLITFATL